MINLGNDPTRDATAGEIPQVPAVAAPTKRKRKARNTVFDDTGIPASGRAAGQGA